MSKTSFKVDKSLVLKPNSAPNDPEKGQMYYDKDAEKLYIYENNNWKSVTDYLSTILLSRSGQVQSGTYLMAGSVPTSLSGPILLGTKKIIGMTVSCSEVLSSNSVLQLQKRTNSTFTDISGAEITINSGNYKAVLSFNSPIILDENCEISCYIKSGTIYNPTLEVVYV